MLRSPVEEIYISLYTFLIFIRINLELFKAKHVMSSPVVTIETKECVTTLAKLLLETTHGGFPVVKKQPDGETVFHGIITRSGP